MYDISYKNAGLAAENGKSVRNFVQPVGWRLVVASSVNTSRMLDGRYPCACEHQPHA
jgi:putative aminopeptidase FrvX